MCMCLCGCVCTILSIWHKTQLYIYLWDCVSECVCVRVLLNFDISNERCNLQKQVKKSKANAKNNKRHAMMATLQILWLVLRHISMKKVQTYGKSAHN